MCGLFGVSGRRLAAKHHNAFTQLGYVSSLRGFDATGVAGVVNEKSKEGKRVVYLEKDNVCSTDFISRKGYSAILRTDPVILIGHCRARTVGTNIAKNAHPYFFDKVCGAHNGTLSGYYHGSNDYGTDSAWLFAEISSKGINKAIGKVEGAWALSWYDREKDTLNFLRNKERDLFIAREVGSDVLFWASEKGMLSWILSRCGVVIEKCVRLRVDTLVSFDPFEVGGIENYTVEEVKGKERPLTEWTEKGFFPEHFKEVEKRKPTKKGLPATASIVSIATSRSPAIVTNANAGSLSSPANSTGSVPSSETTTEQAQGSSVVPFVPDTAKSGYRKNMAKGFKGFLLTKEEVDECLQGGCVYCGFITQFGQPFRWINHNDYLCQRCKESAAFSSIKCDDALYFEELRNN